MTTLPPCCSITAPPGSDPFLAMTVCAEHAAQGWQKVFGKIDCVETLPCGCRMASIQSVYLTRCLSHGLALACCARATPRACVCAFAFDCPTHGERHVGSHD